MASADSKPLESKGASAANTKGEQWDIKKTYRYTSINVIKFRNLLCSQLLIELTPRQAELYIDVITLVLSDRKTR